MTSCHLRKDEANENKDNQKHVIKSNKDLFEIEHKTGIDVYVSANITILMMTVQE